MHKGVQKVEFMLDYFETMKKVFDPTRSAAENFELGMLYMALGDAVMLLEHENVTQFQFNQILVGLGIDPEDKTGITFTGGLKWTRRKAG
jgi:hypothetical protein